MSLADELKRTSEEAQQTREREKQEKEAAEKLKREDGARHLRDFILSDIEEKVRADSREGKTEHYVYCSSYSTWRDSDMIIIQGVREWAEANGLRTEMKYVQGVFGETSSNISIYVVWD
jgi:hypothetical protein